MKNTAFKFNKETDDLFGVILSLKTTKEAEAFFRDLCTVEELKDMSDRWQIVRLLQKGLTYRDISEELKVSTTTVNRVAFWLNNGRGGYSLAIKCSNVHHHKPLAEKGLR
jgi:TrpR-related protein YerC/YecD